MLPLDNPVLQDLLLAIQDDEMTDIALEGHDGVKVTANRFVLAARSKVLKRMLYGSFREASSSIIYLKDYDVVTLEAIVEYCCRNEISKFRVMLHRNAESAKRMVRLYKAADYLELPNLAKIVAQMTHNLTSRYPPLACAVYDEADLDTPISLDALLMITCRPYVTLPPDHETGGGIDCLNGTRLLSILNDREVNAGELFLFEMLVLWVELNNSVGEHGGEQNAIAVAKACAECLTLEYIEPQDLLTRVSPLGFLSEKRITDAITQQALRASKNRVWALSCRGRPDVDRILVEGAGTKETNGMYYKIDGLANGELYSKREVACGQQYVYTLSCSVNKQEEVECRIFCSKLLTHMAVRSLVQRVADLSFQPLMQVIRVEEEESNDTKNQVRTTIV
jgi:hypothetical protein